MFPLSCFCWFCCSLNTHRPVTVLLLEKNTHLTVLLNRMHYCTHGPAVTMETEGGWIMQILSRRLTTRPHVLRLYPRANVGDCQLVHGGDVGGGEQIQTAACSQRLTHEAESYIILCSSSPPASVRQILVLHSLYIFSLCLQWPK